MNPIFQRWAAGDTTAGGELYREYYGRVREYLLKRGATLVDAEDLAQETLIAALNALRGGKTPQRFTYWLLGIARHMRVRRLPSDHELEEAVDPSRRGARTQAIRREMDELLGRTLERLSPADRELLDLLYRAGLSRKEVAERLDVPLEVIHRRCDRAHGRVRASLSQHFTTLVARREERGAVTLEEIRALRPGFRQAVIARHFEDGSERDAAARLGLPEATFRARLRSAYEILKRDPTADFSSAKAAWRKERGL